MKSDMTNHVTKYFKFMIANSAFVLLVEYLIIENSITICLLYSVRYSGICKENQQNGKRRQAENSFKAA